MLGQLPSDLIRIRARFVYFVDGNNDWNLPRFGVVNRLDGLLHYSVICSNHENDDIRHLGSPSPHGREGLVSGRVEKYDIPVIDMDVVGSDSLGDAARFSLDHIGLSNGIQE